MLVSPWQCQSSILVIIYNCALYSLNNLIKNFWSKKTKKKQSEDFY